MKTHIDQCPESVRELYALACQARSHAYSPYSGCRVGAAVRLDDGSLFTGCNVENASYGATVCAERVAVQKAVSERGIVTVSEVMVVTDAHPAWPPCGVCRQVIAEFGPDCRVHIAGLDGSVLTVPFSDLFPHPLPPIAPSP